MITGALAFLVDYGVLMAAYYGLALSLAVATSAGYIVGLLISFFGNRHWVFGAGAKRKNIFLQSGQYIALLIFNYCFTVLGVTWLHDHDVQPYVGKLIIIAFIVCWNYLLFKKFIFGKSDTQPKRR